MKGLIDDLLVLSRVSRFSELTEVVSLNEILNEVLDDLRFSYRRNTSLWCSPPAFILSMQSNANKACSAKPNFECNKI